MDIFWKQNMNSKDMSSSWMNQQVRSILAITTNSSSNATDDQFCSLCYDRSRPIYLNTTIVNSNLTCSSLDLGLQSFMLQTNPSCAVAQDYYATLCGCPQAPRCSGICLDGSLPKYNRTFPISFNDDGVYNVSCMDADVIIKNLPQNNPYCKIASRTSKYCGCTVYDSSCSPCYGNDPIPNLNQMYVYGQGSDKNQSCGTTYLGNIFADYNNISIYGGSCDVRQLFGAIQCDCPKLSPKYNNGCRLCSYGQNVSATAVVQAFNTTMKCKELNIYLNVDSTCTAQKTLDPTIMATCCLQAKSASTMIRVSWILGILVLLLSSTNMIF